MNQCSSLVAESLKPMSFRIWVYELPSGYCGRKPAFGVKASRSSRLESSLSSGPELGALQQGP